ncbi:MAG: Gldg family protein [Planctomycetaceae bacterium]
MLRFHVISAVMRRNVASYFSGVLGYLFIVVFVVAATAMTFTPQFFANNVASLDQLNETFPLLLLFIIPAITMSAWADERKQGTDELLFTLPALDVEILLGKYLAVLTVYTVALLFSVTQLVVLAFYADPDWWLLSATYLGYWLAGATLLSAGMFASALSRSTTVAFVLGVLICSIPVFIADVPGLARIAPIVRDLSLSEQFREFAQGTLPLNGLVYFASLTAFMLYLNLVLISRRHWSGNQQVNMGLQYLLRTACLLVILASFNLMARASTDVLGLRADMTADRLYTLTDSTRQVLESIGEDRPVRIDAFISPEVPREYVPVRKRLIGLLRQYERIGAPRVDLRLLDAAPYSEAAEEADNRGVLKRVIATERGGRQELAEFYLGVVVSSSYGEAILPSLDVDSPLEYELTRAVATVVDRHRRTVGVLDTDAHVIGGFDRATFQSLPRWGIVAELEKQYHVARISPDSSYDEQDSLELFATEARGGGEDDTAELDDGRLPERLAIEYRKVNFEPSKIVRVATIDPGAKWRVADHDAGFRTTVVKKDDKLVAYRAVDVLLAPLPSSLGADQMDRLVSELEGGLPALVFDDPLPVTIGLQNAPMVPKRAGGGMMGMQMPQPEPRADGGLAKRLMTRLGLSWTSKWSFELDDSHVADLEAGRLPDTLPAVYATRDLRLPADTKVEIVEPGREWAVTATHRNSGSAVKTAIVKKGDGLVVSGEPEIVAVWDMDHPHSPKLDDLLSRVPEYVFISPASAGESAFAKNSAVTNGLNEALALFPGRVRRSEGSGLEHAELMMTGGNSGEIPWSDMVASGGSPFNPSPMVREDRRHYRDRFNHVLAMRAKSPKPADSGAGGKAESAAGRRRGIDVVYVADLDFISDYVLFAIPGILREQFDTEAKLDNLEFVFNAIDVLAGDESKIELRKRQYRPRPLTVIQAKIKEYRDQRQQAEEEQIKQAKEEQDRLQLRMEEAQQRLERDSGGNAFSQLQELFTTAAAERRKHEIRLKEIEEEKQRIVDQLKGQERRQVEADEARIRWQAVMFPPIPAILLGAIVLSLRLSRERSAIRPNRSR